jgi:glyoxylase-like metal-dependent hydrolase (beta-lactamase superfamily II)
MEDVVDEKGCSMKLESEAGRKKREMTRREFMEYSALLGISTAVPSGAVGLLSPEAHAFSCVEKGGLDFGETKYVKVSFTNCFLLPCEGGYLQIDVSYPDDYEKYLRGLSEIGIKLSDIKYLLLTHHHDDHSGFATEFIRNTGARMIVHENALPYLEMGKSEEVSRPINGCVKFVLGAFSVFHEFVFPPVIPKEDDYIISGDDSAILKEIGIDGKILYTPGHTDDSISVILSDGSTFVGDVAMDFMNICGCRHRPIYVQDIDEVYRSWEGLRKGGAKVIYPAHGRPFSIEELAPV